MEYWSALVSLLRADPLSAAAVGVSLLALAFALALSVRLSSLTQGSDGKSLEDMIKKLGERAGRLEGHAGTAEKAFENIDRRLASAVRGIAVERFDPFQNAGGQQSFSTALLNEKGDGVVISGIHSRDSVRVYAKEIKEFTSERELSEEEKKAIARARGGL